MNAVDWLSVAVLAASTGAALDVALGMRKIGRLRDTPPTLPSTLPSVSIIVTALNEADTIEPAMHSLLALDYPALELIAIDDRSTDATGSILDRIAAAHPRLRVEHIRTLPAGWLGKNHALWRAAGIARGDYLLFTDADVVYQPSTLTRAIAYCQRHRVDHLTLLFDVIARSTLLRMLLLSMMAGFLSRFRPWKVSASARHFIGVGAFNLVRATAYRAIGSHQKIPLAVLDDMMLGKMIKQSGFRQHVLSGQGLLAIEWYRGTRELIRGIEKNAFAALDYQLWQLIAVTLLVGLLRIWPWFALVTTATPAWQLNAASIAVTLALYIDLLRETGWRYRCLWYLPVVPWIELAGLWRSTVLVLWRGGIRWRGTFYPLKDLKADKRP